MGGNRSGRGRVARRPGGASRVRAGGGVADSWGAGAWVSSPPLAPAGANPVAARSRARRLGPDHRPGPRPCTGESHRGKEEA